MKQLKVVVNDEQSLVIAAQGGYVTANFVTPIEIPAGSFICLDKFNATSKNISQNFTVQSQTFQINVNGVTGTSPISVLVPGGIYPTIKSYMAAINQAVNSSAVSAYRPVPLNAYNANDWINVQSQNSMGLNLTTTGPGQTKSIWLVKTFGISSLSTTPSLDWTPTLNLGTNVDSFHYSTDTLEASLTSLQVCNGGGLSTTAALFPSTSGTVSWQWGFVSSSGTLLGGKIGQKVGSTNLWVWNDANVATEITGSSTLFAAAYAGDVNNRFVLCQNGGNFGFFYSSDVTVNQNPVTPYCFTGSLAGKMGNWNYAYTYTVTATIYSGTVTPFANLNYTPANGGNAGDPVTPNTNTTIDLTAVTASQLALALGYSQQVYIVAPPEGAYTSTLISDSIINLNQLRSAFELAIEVLDIPLKTYFAQTLNSQYSGAGGRQNVVCYFTPETTILTEGLYSFSNSVHQWLEIDNKSSTWIHSLSFRIFNPYSGLSFISNSMGFNLLIKDKSELSSSY